MTKSLISTLLICLLGLQACQPDTEKSKPNLAESASAPEDPKLTTTINSDSITTAAQQIDETGFMRHVEVLASDEYEGRAPSTPGGAKTVAYLEKAFADAGLAPAFGDSYRQAVGLMEITVTNEPALRFTHQNESSSELPYKQNSVVFTSRTADKAKLDESPLVFVGYGVVAPEYDWNDYAGLDMTGKTAVILVNDPGYRKPEGERFKGKAMTYYGRWTYKFEEAARQGAAGAIIVHETGAAGYPWEVVSGSWSGPQYNLYTTDGNVDNLEVESWIDQAAAEQLFSQNGLDYTTAVEQAGEPGFKPIALTSKASTELQLTTRKSDSYNVAGIIKGRERPDEAFIYTAHWDHLGIKDVPEGEDAIFNGAQDNATGTAALIEIAEAFSALPNPPERSVILLAVTAEESGLLGSKAYAEAPPIAMRNTVAGINIDAMATAGETDDIVVVGYGNSEMDDFLRTQATRQGRVVVPEPTPEKGFFYRSDHFNLAKKGVPMLYAEAGEQVRGKPEGYGREQAQRYGRERYHKAGDEIIEDWDNGGILQDMDALFRIGVEIADSDVWPQWSEGNEFKAIREASQ